MTMYRSRLPSCCGLWISILLLLLLGTGLITTAIITRNVLLCKDDRYDVLVGITLERHGLSLYKQLCSPNLNQVVEWTRSCNYYEYNETVFRELSLLRDQSKSDAITEYTNIYGPTMETWMIFVFAYESWIYPLSVCLCLIAVLFLLCLLGPVRFFYTLKEINLYNRRLAFTNKKHEDEIIWDDVDINSQPLIERGDDDTVIHALTPPVLYPHVSPPPPVLPLAKINHQQPIRQRLHTNHVTKTKDT